jgi:hypothetical protein
MGSFLPRNKVREKTSIISEEKTLLRGDSKESSNVRVLLAHVTQQRKIKAVTVLESLQRHEANNE